MDICLKVENLSVDVEGHPILRDLSFEVERGEKMMIVGPNGAGKTTLFRALMGFIPYEGEVEWKERYSVRVRPSERGCEPQLSAGGA